MYFLLAGELEVTTSGHRLGFLNKGAFFGEVPLLTSETGAKIRRRTITGCTLAKLCFLLVPDVVTLMEMFPELKLRVIKKPSMPDESCILKIYF